MTTPATSAAPLTAHARLIRAAADLLEQAGIPGLAMWPDRTRSRSRFPSTAVTCRPRRGGRTARRPHRCGARRPPPGPDTRLDSRPRAVRRAPLAHLHPSQGATGIMTTATITDRSALGTALRQLNLSGMLGTLDARLAQARAGELGHLDFLQVLCQDEISRRETTLPAPADPRRPVRPPPPWKDSTSPRPRNCPPPRSATSPRCAGCSQGNRSSCTGRSGKVRATSRRPSRTWPSAPEPTPGS